MSFSSIWLCFPMTFIQVLSTFDNWEIACHVISLLWVLYCWIVEKKTMRNITTCQELPLTQPWYRKKCSFASYTNDHDTGTWQSLQRTRHVNMSSLAGLLDTVCPIGKLPVNKISVLYHPLLPFPDLPSPLHVLIMTAVQCVRTGVDRWDWACWSILLLFTTLWRSSLS